MRLSPFSLSATRQGMSRIAERHLCGKRTYLICLAPYVSTTKIFLIDILSKQRNSKNLLRKSLLSKYSLSYSTTKIFSSLHRRSCNSLDGVFPFSRHGVTAFRRKGTYFYTFACSQSIIPRYDDDDDCDRNTKPHSKSVCCVRRNSRSAICRELPWSLPSDSKRSLQQMVHQREAQASSYILSKYQNCSSSYRVFSYFVLFSWQSFEVFPPTTFCTTRTKRPRFLCLRTS